MEKKGHLPSSFDSVAVVVDTELPQQVDREKGPSQADLVREAECNRCLGESASVLPELPPDESISAAIPSVFTAISARDLNQSDHLMAEYDGKVKLVTNVASLCKTTDTNYEELVQLYDRFLPQGFEILGFPCRQFKEQEHADPEEIKNFVANYNVSFPLFDLTIVNGPKTHPVFLYCKWHSEELYGRERLQDIEWNFGKFLLDRNNRVYKYYKHDVNPLMMMDDIRKLLAGELVGRERGPDGKFVNPLPQAARHTRAGSIKSVS